MMVTILLGEQGAMIALSSHSDPPLIYFYLKRPVSSHRGNPLIYSDLRRPGSSHSGPPLIYSLGQCDGWIHKHTQRDGGRDTIIRHTVRQAVWHQKKPWEGSTLSLAYGRFTGRRSLTMSGLSVA